MANDEEYLDNLLKSMMDNEQQSNSMEAVLNEMPSQVHSDLEESEMQITDPIMEKVMDENNFNTNELEEMLKQLENNDNSQVNTNDPAMEETQNPDEALLSSNEDNDLEEDLIEDIEDNITPDLDVTDFNISDLDLSGLDSLNINEQDLNLDNMDVTELIDSMGDSDDDLAEINGLLKKSDNNESIDEDMLALLEGAEENKQENPYEESEAFDIFNDEGLEEIREEKTESKVKSKNTKKGKKTKRKKDNKKSENTESIEQEDIAFNENELDELFKEKKPGFFARLIQTLTEEDEPKLSLGDLDENEEILKELDAEDKVKEQNKIKKKKKEDKKSKKKNKVTEAPADGEEADGEDDTLKNKKPKKEKKVKVKKEKPPKEKPVKVLTKKKMIVLILFCLTLIAGVTALSIFLPDYADRKNAVKAYYEGNYEAVYQLLYDKKMDTGDELMYNRAKTIITLQRRIQSYHNYTDMNKPVEALDALMQGIIRYPQLTVTDAYGVREEIDSVYDQICSLLNEQYNISEEEAKEICGYDNETYSLKLYSVVNGTEFVKPGDETALEPLVPQDILPEEEDIINE